MPLNKETDTETIIQGTSENSYGVIGILGGREDI